MAIELVVPKVGESIAEVEVVQWMKKEGEQVERDETIVVLDTAKTTVELPSPIAGTVGKILKQEGDAVGVGEALALLEEGGTSNGASASAAPQAATEEVAPKPTVDDPEWQKPPVEETGGDAAPHANGNGSGNGFVMPAAERLLTQNNLQASDVAASGPGGRVLKEDVTRHLQGQAAKPAEGSGVVQGNPEISTIEQPAPKQPDGTAPQATPAAKPDTKTSAPAAAPASERATGQGEEKVRMSLLRREIARKLVEAQQTAALLTTFNEVDMGPVMAMRKEYQDAFTKKYGIKLGFMSFFVKAVIDALKAYPAINAEIRGNEIVYRNYFDIGVAIGGGKGLVVPTLRNAELMSFSQIESEISALAKRAKEGTLKPEELEGGTFSITNGGIYGSLLSTPIVNAPQSGILGMHAIQDRPVARDGQVVIRPMMYLALTYDHRIVDGREAVSFLVRIKECIENPARMLLEV